MSIPAETPEERPPRGRNQDIGPLTPSDGRQAGDSPPLSLPARSRGNANIRLENARFGGEACGLEVARLM
jgi:hypothetical protein